MYRTINEGDTITMWDISHNTIAGDVAVTVFIQVRLRSSRPSQKMCSPWSILQGILTFVIASGMVHVDQRKGKIAAFPYPWVRYPPLSADSALRLLRYVVVLINEGPVLIVRPPSLTRSSPSSRVPTPKRPLRANQSSGARSTSAMGSGAACTSSRARTLTTSSTSA